MESKEFDDIIKEKLEGISESPDERSWDLFVLQALDKGEEEIFDDKSTDELVKGALNNIKPDYNAGSWDALLSKMEKPDGEDPVLLQKRFDKEVSNSLKSVTRKYDAASWPKLAARIDAEEKYLRHYYRAKFVEACVFIFLILSLVQLSESGKLKVPTLSNGATEINNEIVNSNIPNTGSSDLNNNVLSPATTNQDKTQESKLFDIKNIVKQAGKNLKSNTHFIKDKIQSSFTSKPVDETKAEKIKPNTEFTALPPIAYDINTKPLLNDIAPVQSNEGRKALDKTIASLADANSSAARLKPVHAVLNEVTELNIPKRSLALSALKKSKGMGEWKIGAYTHFDYNEIYFPKQELEVRGNAINTVLAKTVKSLGYGSGFKALYTKNRLGVEFGVGYSNKSYAPERSYYGNPDLNAHFNNIEYDIVEIPIALRFRSKANTRLRPYMQAGINGSFIVKEFYQVSVAAKSVATSTGTRSNSEQSSFQASLKTEFTKLDNTKVMAYGQGSLGLEWSLNDRIDISSQINYSQRFLTKKFGLNFDQSKSLSLEIGIKTKL